MRTVKLSETGFDLHSEEELVLAAQLDGCVYHKDRVAGCDAAIDVNGSWYTVAGDLWCEGALLEFTRSVSIDELDVALIDFDDDAPASDEIYGVTGADAQWIRDNVGLN